MKYQITTFSGSMTLRFPCEHVAAVVDSLTGLYGDRFDVLPMVYDLLSDLEHVARVDDVWITVAPMPH